MNKTQTITNRSQRILDGQTVDNCELVELDGDCYFKISNVHLMPEFMMSLTSSSNHWMFVSSAGALTAGRRTSDNALFPYYSHEKIIDTRQVTGPRTIVHVAGGKKPVVWQPFFDQPVREPRVVRNLYKNPLGNKICLEEVNVDLGLIFRYRWTFSQQFGFIRTSRIHNCSDKKHSLDLLDGIQNIVPFGVNESMQLMYGNLIDAYKKNELTELGVGIHYLSSIPSDRAEPSEGLRATAVWHTKPAAATLISSIQINDFINGKKLESEHDIRARRGAHLLNYRFELPAQQEVSWDIIADLQQDQTDIANLSIQIQAKDILAELKADIDSCEQGLAMLVARSDGFQSGELLGRTQRHQSNVIFNIMRGGIPAEDYTIASVDLRRHVLLANSSVAQRNAELLDSIPEKLDRAALLDLARQSGDVDLFRIVTEYIPLVFSRRHGDPTRPWNKFAINSHFGDDEILMDYQGNWRDIFQNWEALAVSYPCLLESMICRFVNASTADGHNPYRLTKNGFEWEAPEPDNPWANIGYWGDHQIIYLAKLVEMSRNYFPGELDQLLNEDCFVYANVPYRIKPFEEILKDPCDTVVYDFDTAKSIEERVTIEGNDAKLLDDGNGNISRATLAEKLLLPGLVKMTNFVPDGGIWLNTQRPEWNDANNALVGNGMSVVTACYLRRYFAFLVDWFENCSQSEFKVSSDINLLLQKIELAIAPYVEESEIKISNSQRHQIVCDLSTAGSNYRQSLYANGRSPDFDSLSIADCNDFLNRCIRMIDATIRSNRRADGLYHSYNLMSLDVPKEVQVERLYEMLEGQVAVLSSKLLEAKECIDILDTMKNSALYREEQNSYMLYPNRDLPRFMEKNLIPSGLVNQSPLMQAMLRDGDESIVRKDVFGNCHFNGDFRNANDVIKAVENLATASKYEDLLEGAAQQLASVFENMFCHHQFTGRSGTFFAYEGLGSIYWHQVSKLLLAVGENYIDFEKSGADAEVLQALKEHFREIQAGIGAEKSPNEYGAFPTDPYSHTPEHAGAQQPGMTGQVKEDILCRFMEIGLRVENGMISFEPSMFDPDEFASDKHEFITMEHSTGELVHASYEAGTFVFSICGVPVVFRRSAQTRLVVCMHDGTEQNLPENSLSDELTALLFRRTGQIKRIEYSYDPAIYS